MRRALDLDQAARPEGHPYLTTDSMAFRSASPRSPLRIARSSGVSSTAFPRGSPVLLLPAVGCPHPGVILSLAARAPAVAQHAFRYRHITPAARRLLWRQTWCTVAQSMEVSTTCAAFSSAARGASRRRAADDVAVDHGQAWLSNPAQFG